MDNNNASVGQASSKEYVTEKDFDIFKEEIGTKLAENSAQLSNLIQMFTESMFTKADTAKITSRRLTSTPPESETKHESVLYASPDEDPENYDLLQPKRNSVLPKGKYRIDENTESFEDERTLSTFKTKRQSIFGDEAKKFKTSEKKRNSKVGYSDGEDSQESEGDADEKARYYRKGFEEFLERSNYRRWLDKPAPNHFYTLSAPDWRGLVLKIMRPNEAFSFFKRYAKFRNDHPGAPMPKAKSLISESVIRQLQAYINGECRDIRFRHLRLTNLDEMSMGELKSLLQESMAPFSKSDFLETLNAGITFPELRKERDYYMDNFRVLYNMVITYSTDFLEYYDYLQEGCETVNVPALEHKIGQDMSLKQLYINRMPFQLGIQIDAEISMRKKKSFKKFPVAEQLKQYLFEF